MDLHFNFLIILFCITSYSSIAYTQSNDHDNLCINLRTEKIVIGLDNPIDIVYPQSQPIEKDDITVEFQHYKTKVKRILKLIERSGYYYIRPDSMGTITITVNTEDGIKTKNLKTKTFTATGRLSHYGAQYDGKISAGEFKVQSGIIARIENYDIDARCAIDNYQIIRIDKSNNTIRTTNKGGKFKTRAKEIIAKASPGDLFIFRKIYYRCPGDDNIKRLDDMTFEIK